MRIAYIFICLLLIISCKKTDKTHNSDFVYIPILKTQNGAFSDVFDQVIKDETICSENKEIDYSVQFLIDTTREYSSNIGDTIILIGAHKYSRKYCASNQINKTLYGSAFYKNHLFYIFSEFRNTNWFKIGNKVQRLLLIKSKYDTKDSPPVSQEADRWIFAIKNQNLILLEKEVRCNQAKEIIQIE